MLRRVSACQMEEPAGFFASARQDDALRMVARGLAGRMTGLGEGEYEALAEHRLGRSGLVVKLDKGFDPGVYYIYAELRGRARYVTKT